MLPRFHQSSGRVQSPVQEVFAHLDDHRRLSSHMSEPSWRMGWSRMTTEVDERRGQEVGSRIQLSGQVLGLRIAVDEMVVERISPCRKVWKRTGEPKLLVMSHYRMGFELVPQAQASMLRVFIETTCRNEDSHGGSDACSVSTTQGGAPNRWSMTRSRTSKLGLPRAEPFDSLAN